MILLKNNIKYYYYSNDNSYKESKIRYIVYGSVILALALLLFFLELFNGFGITKVLDYFISISMFSDMIIGIIFIVKGALLKDNINASGFNMTNAKIENDEIKTSAGVIRYLSIIPMLFNISIIVFYVLTLFYKRKEISFVMIFSFIVGILLNISVIMAFFSLDGENEVYSGVKENENFSQIESKNI